MCHSWGWDVSQVDNAFNEAKKLMPCSEDTLTLHAHRAQVDLSSEQVQVQKLEGDVQGVREQLTTAGEEAAQMREDLDHMTVELDMVRADSI